MLKIRAKEETKIKKERSLLMDIKDQKAARAHGVCLSNIPHCRHW
jgi:hypothetical protein